MQKDVHYYMTLALARRAGLTADVAEKIAWADQMTDENKEAGLYGLQTAVKIALGNWPDRMIQRDVIVPFHFVPGDNPDWPWSVTKDSRRIRTLINEAGDNPFRLGVALHALQDSYSHQGFSGWLEDRNSCITWDSLWSIVTPNIGHADRGLDPDIANATWYDPRSQESADNRLRVMSAAFDTYRRIFLAFNESASYEWPKIDDEIRPLLQMKYDDRKDALLEMAGEGAWRFKSGTKDMQEKYMDKFLEAAAAHQVLALELCKDLPVF